ncbi:MAG: phosphate signaling complex protein PhoU [Acetobacteraceae bacterium]|nr:phosphate signaling complex protein PhoU [Acetobacteraceae bacterium]MDW8398587.1 phosphate signaling complex protein PhoU [Acetobacteraceae bacterium]
MNEQLPQHVIKSYDEDLRQLRDMIARMGGLAERQVADSTYALMRRDPELAALVVERDAEIDRLQREIETFAIQLIALRQPVAADLRLIVGALKIAGDIERIGDYAKNDAKRAIVLAKLPPIGSMNGFQRLARLVQENLKEAMDALVSGDAARARRVWASDVPVDEITNGIFREMVTYMMEDPRSITAGTHMLFIAKNLERIGDHTTNIAETIYYAVHGDKLPEARPKASDDGPAPKAA